MNEVELQSLDVSEISGPITLSWDLHPGASAYVLCQLSVPVGPKQATAFFTGGLDLMMTRWVLPPDQTAVSEPAERSRAHRLLIARQGRTLVAVSCRLEPGAAGPLVESFGPPSDRWDAGPRVGSPPPEPESPGPRMRSNVARAFVEEAESTPAGPKRVGFVERSMSVRYGPAGREADPLPTIGQAYEGLRPRGAAGSRLPSLSGMGPPDPGEAPGGPPLWVVVASPDLIIERSSARRALRALRGYFRVAVAGARDRGLLERRVDRLGVPLDGVYALESDSPRLAAALGCHPTQIVLIVREGDAVLEGAIRVEATSETLVSVVMELCQDE